MEKKYKLLSIFYEIIERFNAYGIQTEHRYYGRSWPTKWVKVKGNWNKKDTNISDF